MVSDMLMLALAVGIPWAVIFLLLKLIQFEVSRISSGLLITIAFFMALPANAILGWIWLHTDFSALLLLLLMSILATSLGIVVLRRPGANRAKILRAPESGAFTPAAIVLLGLAITHLGVAGWFNLHLGFVAWDAWDSWMLASKTWFHAGEMSPLLSFGEWARSSDAAAYSLHHSQTHWPTLSLATVWHAAVIGAWNEQVLTLPWWIAFCFLVFGVYSFLRNRGCNMTLASAGAFMMSTLPLLGFHAALAGYADIWVAGLLFSSVAYLVVAATARNRATFVIPMVLFLSLASVKVTALFWVPIVAGSCLFVWLFATKYKIGRRALYLLGGVTVATVVGLIFAVSDNSFEERVANLEIFAGEAFLGWNWALAWWYFWAAFLTSIFMRFERDREVLLIIGGISIIFLATIFSNEFIVKSHEVIATSNRLVLQLMPIIVSSIILVSRDSLDTPSV